MKSSTVHRFLFLLLVLVLNGWAADRPSERQYPIVLSRKATVGERYHVVAKGSDEQRMEMIVDGETLPANGEATEVEVRAEAEVLALTPSGFESKTSLVIESATVTQAGKSVALLPPGTTVVAERVAGKTRYLVAGVADARIDRLLSTAGVASFSDDADNDDVIYGSKTPRKVGESWPINSAAAAASLAAQGVPATPENLTGTTTLVELVEAGGSPALRISGSTSVDGITPPAPPGLSIQSSNFFAIYSGIFPVNPVERVRQEQMSIQLRVVAVGTNAGKTATVTMTRKESHERLVTPSGSGK